MLQYVAEMMKRILAAAAIVACSAGLAACGASNSNDAQSQAPVAPSKSGGGIAAEAKVICPELQTKLSGLKLPNINTSTINGALTTVDKYKGSLPASLQAEVAAVEAELLAAAGALSTNEPLAQDKLNSTVDQVSAACAKQGAPWK